MKKWWSRRVVRYPVLFVFFTSPLWGSVWVKVVASRPVYEKWSMERWRVERPDFRSRVVEKDGVVYTEVRWMGWNRWAIPSGDLICIYGTDGAFVDGTVDVGEDDAFFERWKFDVGGGGKR
jgi:hypothetical protein